MTTAPSGSDPTECRVFSLPAHLLANLDGAVKLLCAEELWTRGDDPASDTVQDTISAYAAIIDAAYDRGCMLVGEIKELATDTVPAWGLLCDGTTYLNTDYPELAAVINDGLRVDADHFRTPDRINRFALAGPPFGQQGGEATHVLTVTEMPAHNHTDTGHQHGYTSPTGEFLALGPGEEPVVLAQIPALTASGNAAITNTGGGAGHNNMPPWEASIFVIVARSSP
jgi:microcystin-dependent protein